MSIGEIISVTINLAVGIYFAIVYPRSLAKRFAQHTTPRAFVFLKKVVPPMGWLIIAITLAYVAFRLVGSVSGAT